MTQAIKKRIVIIGGGSSGLISLRHMVEMLPDWDVTCFEKTGTILGCWGMPYSGFVSTSTKYTTQFSTYASFDASYHQDGGASRSEFFREGEYGEYLQSFADHHGLHSYIRLFTQVQQIRYNQTFKLWELDILDVSRDNSKATKQTFDAVIVATGLAAVAKEVESNIPVASLKDVNRTNGELPIRGQRIVVLGGGESAVDYAVRLSNPELQNKVYLSLQSGIRVSPRYHPIRGVPSDFLRNRLMLSIHEDIRNWIGEHFVRFRIRYQERMEHWFPPVQRDPTTLPQTNQELNTTARKYWADLLTRAAKDDLFNMFHNKSDDFLDCVAEGRITIVGPSIGPNYRVCKSFESDEEIEVDATLLVPSIGYRSTLGELTQGQIPLQDFYLGLSHIHATNLFLVGFARPIIGNIPSISELQARCVSSLLSGRIELPPDIARQHANDELQNQKRFSKLNRNAIYPVEMFPYCDRLAKWLGQAPTLRRIGSIPKWLRIQLTPTTTMHYWCHDENVRSKYEKSPIYMPPLLIAILVGLKPLDYCYRWVKRFLKMTGR